MATLKSQAQTWATNRTKSSVSGLALMLKIIDHMAEHRDWDAAAWFLKYTKDDRLIPTIFKRLLSERFGKNISLKTNTSKHASTFEFTFKTKDPIVAPNVYGKIAAFSADGGGYSSNAFKKLLADFRVKKVAPVDVAKRAKAIYKDMTDKGIPLAALITALRAAEKEANPSGVTNVIEGGKAA